MDTEVKLDLEYNDVLLELKKINQKIDILNALNIDLLGYTQINPINNRNIQLNWVKYFVDGIADAEIWRDTIIPDIYQTYNRVGNSNPQPVVAVRQRATISTGIAFGSVFTASSGIRVLIEQRTDSQGVQWWSTQEDRLIDFSLLEEQHIPIESTSMDTLIEVGVTQDIKCLSE